MSVLIVVASTTLDPLYHTPLVKRLSIHRGLFYYHFLYHPISRDSRTDYPPTSSSEPILPFCWIFSLSVNCHQSKYYIHWSYIIIISKTRHPISREPIFPYKKGYFITRSCPKPSVEPILQFISPYHQQSLFSPFCC